MGKFDDGIDKGIAQRILIGTIGDRVGIVGRRRTETIGTLLHVPPVVIPLRDDGDLLPEILPGVSDEESIITAGVESHTIGITEAVSPGLIQSCCVIHKRVVLGDGVRLPSIHVDTQDATQQILTHRLGVASLIDLVPILNVACSRIIRATPIAQPDVEITIRTKKNGARVMVRLRLVDSHDNTFRLGFGLIGIL